MPTFEKKDQNVVARARTSLPGRRHCCLDADVVARALKFGVFVKKHPSHVATVVARAQTLSLGHRRRRPSAEVWGVCEKTPLPRSTCRRTGADVVARAHAFSPGCRRCRSSVDVVARANTLSPGRRRLWSPDDDRRRCCARRPRLRPNLTGYTRPSLPFSPHFASIRSFLAWTCPPAAPCENFGFLFLLCYLFM